MRAASRYQGCEYLEKNIAVWVQAGHLLAKFDERARAEMQANPDGLSAELAAQIVEAGTAFEPTATKLSQGLAVKVAAELRAQGHCALALRNAPRPPQALVPLPPVPSTKAETKPKQRLMRRSLHVIASFVLTVTVAWRAGQTLGVASVSSEPSVNKG